MSYWIRCDWKNGRSLIGLKNQIKIQFWILKFFKIAYFGSNGQSLQLMHSFERNSLICLAGWISSCWDSEERNLIPLFEKWKILLKKIFSSLEWWLAVTRFIEHIKDELMQKKEEKNWPFKNRFKYQPFLLNFQFFHV